MTAPEARAAEGRKTTTMKQTETIRKKLKATGSLIILATLVSTLSACGIG